LPALKPAGHHHQGTETDCAQSCVLGFSRWDAAKGISERYCECDWQPELHFEGKSHPSIEEQEFNMKKPTYILIGLASLLLVLGTVIATATAPSARWAATYDNLKMPPGFKAMMVLVDFPPNSVFPLHSHGGPVIAMVIEGEITLVQKGVTKVYKTGQSFNEPLGLIHEARNLGSTKAAVMVTYLLPKGAKPDIFVSK
jgi:quercetin dioxygenase-like cupin family protein